MLSQIDRILEDISLQMNEENEQFSETVRKMLEIMEYDTPYTRKNTYGKTGVKVQRWIPQKLFATRT